MKRKVSLALIISTKIQTINKLEEEMSEEKQNRRDSKESVENKKEFLRAYGKAKKETTRLKWHLEEIMKAYELPKAITISDMPKAKGKIKDLSDYMVKYEEVLTKVLTANNKQLELLQKIEGEIENISDVEEKMVLELKYIKGMEWEQLAKEMGVSRSTATRLHGKALLELGRACG